MTTSANSHNQSLLRDILHAARYYLGGSTGLVVIATFALGAGAYFNWGWLVAAGIAPLIITVLPCAAMCALGLCMGGRSKTSNADQSASDGAANPTDARLSLPLAASNGEGETATPDAITKPVPSSNRKDCC
jgi:hypothetical protein